MTEGGLVLTLLSLAHWTTFWTASVVKGKKKNKEVYCEHIKYYLWKAFLDLNKIKKKFKQTK